MLHIYIWTRRWQGLPIASDWNWGHAAMWIERPTVAQSRYVSWWPREGAAFVAGNTAIGFQSNIARDVGAERAPPDHILLVNRDREELVESAMVAEWDRRKRQTHYRATDMNCARMVATLLIAGGAPYDATDHVTNERTVWFPESLLDYLRWLGGRFPIWNAPRPWRGPRPGTPT